jgi:hypothetical protein
MMKSTRMVNAAVLSALVSAFSTGCGTANEDIATFEAEGSATFALATSTPELTIKSKPSSSAAKFTLVIQSPLTAPEYVLTLNFTNRYNYQAEEVSGVITPGSATQGGKVTVYANATGFARLQQSCNVGSKVKVFYDNATNKVSNVTCQ